MSNVPKFAIVMEKGAIVEIYSSSEMEYTIVNYDKRCPVEGAWATVDLDCDLKELWFPSHVNNDPKRLKIYKRIFRKLLKLKF
jgi:hypothetical protein